MTQSTETIESTIDQHAELQSYLDSINQKINLAEDRGQIEIAKILKKICTDIKKWVTAHQDEQVSFYEAHQEIVSLHVFTEIYLELDELGFH